MLTWTRYTIRENWFIDATARLLVGIAVLAVAFAIVMMFTTPALPFNCSQDDTECDYQAFYGEDYYPAHHEQALFGIYSAVIVSWSANWKERVVHVQIDESILDGTDANCRIFGFVMKHITTNDVLVVVTNTGYIPSTRNPIDHAWATHLAYPDGVPYMPAE